MYSRGPAIVRSGTRLSSSPFLPLLSLFATLPASTFTKFGSQIVNGKITNCQRQNCRACLNQPWMIPFTAMALTLSSHAKTKRAIASEHKIPWPNCLQLCHIKFNSTRLMDQDASFFPYYLKWIWTFSSKPRWSHVMEVPCASNVVAMCRQYWHQRWLYWRGDTVHVL